MLFLPFSPAISQSSQGPTAVRGVLLGHRRRAVARRPSVGLPDEIPLHLLDRLTGDVGADVFAPDAITGLDIIRQWSEAR